ncbi:MAG TPA: serine/threonine-protein kinase [Vicinamibacterales bacterium]|nr:serine/threonine-protein kinase [Vicinamibacterales bacterium]
MTAMDPGRWRQLQDLFAAARTHAPAERERLLREEESRDPALVDRVRALLAADESGGILDSLSPHIASVAQLVEAEAPVRVGAYRIVSELGRGGMGAVYLADRVDGNFQQRVAIKMIGTSDADDPLHQRFIAERRILAGLIHPHIARLLDGGVTEDRRPYLVMEYVDGLPITRYCDRQQLDINARLRLFVDVCGAVQHAHQNLVIHRDLKPSNILVSADGVVHLLDFGIAKLIESGTAAAPQTRIESRMMTPEYASPEQVRGETLGTASDIYSLGVLLYELLCGCAPYRFSTRSPLEVATLVCEQDPVRPGVRVKELEGDLDGIVMMAMRKEPGRRYASVDMLRQDIERHLAGLPVMAHRGGRRYRIGKFVRRHRVEAAAATAVGAALVIGLSVAVVQGRRATRERDRAEQALAESNGVTDFLLELFRTGETGEVPATQLTALDLLRRGALQADDLSNQPMVHARLLDVIGQMSFNLGRLDEAQARLEQAVAIRRSAGGAEDLARSLIHLSWVHRTRNHHDRARPLVMEALDLRRRALPAGHPDIADALYELGWIAYGAEQERLYRQALEILTPIPAAADRRMTMLQGLATNLRRQGRLPEAVAAARDALAVAEGSYGPEHHTTGSAMIHLGDHVNDIEEDAAAAERLYRRGLELLTRHYGEGSIRLLHGMNSLVGLLGSRGDTEAEAIARRALAISQSATGPEHPRVADQMHKLASALTRLRRLAEAETLARESLALTIRAMGPGHQVVASSRLPLLAQIFDLQRRHAEADQTYEAAIAKLATSAVLNGEVRRQYALVLIGRGDVARAEAQLLQSLSSLELAYGGRGHPNVHETGRVLMTLYRRTGRPDLVERYRVPPGRFIPY